MRVVAKEKMRLIDLSNVLGRNFLSDMISRHMEIFDIDSGEISRAST